MDIRSELIEKSSILGIEIHQEQADKFQTYLDILLAWNQKINLTAITDPHEAVVKHFVDSLAILQTVEIHNGAKVIDVGTGAGFPGVPLKIMRPEIELTLLDGLNKRLNFLRDLSDNLGFEAEFIHMRAEEAGKKTEMREKYDIVTARAVAQLNVLCEYCIPLVKMKGCFIAMKGPGIDPEIAEANKAIQILGCRVDKVEQIILPDTENSERNLAVIRKYRYTPKEYPRHGNKISKSPIM